MGSVVTEVEPQHAVVGMVKQGEETTQIIKESYAYRAKCHKADDVTLMPHEVVPHTHNRGTEY